MKITIYDVAKKANVSIATVSKVINDSGNMREETRERVKRAIKELDYHPNFMASALNGKGSRTLGLLVPDISNPFFSAMAKHIEDYAHHKGMSLIVCSIDGDKEKERKYIDLLQSRQTDGIIVASTFHDRSLLKGLIKKEIPIVMLGYDDSSLDTSIVSIDDFKGGYEAGSHLFSIGHRDNVMVIAEHVHSSDLRIYGFKVALEARGIQLKDENIIRVTASIENGRNSFNEIIQQQNKSDRPTAIFACNDLIAIGIIQGANENNIAIPRDLSVIGYDNTILATTTSPGLTTIAQPFIEMANKTVDVLLDEIREDVRVKKRILFDPELIVRGTT